MSCESETAITSIDENATGTWRVYTLTSSYLIDLDAMTLSRRPGDDIGIFVAAGLRRDGECLTLLALRPVVVGECATFLLAGLGGDGVVTKRVTNPVAKIEQVVG